MVVVVIVVVVAVVIVNVIVAVIVIAVILSENVVVAVVIVATVDAVLNVALNIFVVGPWWWYSGQSSRLLLRRSEFDPSCLPIIFPYLYCEKRRNGKRGRGWPIFKKYIFVADDVAIPKVFLLQFFLSMSSSS